MTIKPVITEKSYRIAAGDKNTKRQFSFYIDPSLNKFEAKNLIERIYKVDITDLNIVNKKNKKITFRRINGQTQARKKIIITLKPGQMIKAFELEEKKEAK